MKQPNPLEFTVELATALADYYEYSMAQANLREGIAGKEAVFDMVVRQMPTTSVVGRFEHEGVKYDQLAKRDFLVNAGLEQAAAYLLKAKGSPALRKYLLGVQGIDYQKDQSFLDWAEKIKFTGDLYAMPEGTIFFGQEPQLRAHGDFETVQVFESLLLNTINPQTNVATTANDIATVTDKILLEGGSRRAGSPQGALFNSRAARIGGFHASSNVAFGMEYQEKVGGTHGHSYVMLHPSEYAAFKAQGRVFGNNVCFLLDTYNVKVGLMLALGVVAEEKLEHFAFRIDSGNLLEQAAGIHAEMKARGYARERYTLVASDDLTAGKIAHLEREGADIDKYLVGTYVVNPPKPLGGVLKLAAFHDALDGEWVLRGKLAEDMAKSTLPGIKQVYRIAGPEGYYKRDVIAFEGEDISKYVEKGDTVKELLVPIIKSGKQVYDFPGIDEISRRRAEQLNKFQDLGGYEVIVSEGITQEMNEIRREHGYQEV